jgi:RimJ/RimL family protein N-acetyltransferase
MSSIETERLLLRKLRRDDLDDLAALFADADVVRYVGDGQPAGRDEAERALHSTLRRWQEQGFGRWAVLDRATEQFIGIGGFRSLFGTPEVVYHLAKQHWGKGYATELARAALRFGFEDRGFERIVAIAKPQNTASIHVMEKLGMQFEKHARYYDIDVVQYQIHSADFSWQGAIYRIVRDTES